MVTIDRFKGPNGLGYYGHYKVYNGVNGPAREYSTRTTNLWGRGMGQDATIGADPTGYNEIGYGTYSAGDPLGPAIGTYAGGTVGNPPSSNSASTNVWAQALAAVSASMAPVIKNLTTPYATYTTTPYGSTASIPMGTSSLANPLGGLNLSSLSSYLPIILLGVGAVVLMNMSHK